MRIDRVKLISEMVRQDMNQLQLVKLSGISRSTISAVQNGRSCSKETASKIAYALNVPLEALTED